MRCKCGSDVNIERDTPTSLCDVCHYKAQVEAQRETVAQWILSLGMSTGHGDTIDDLLLECGAQIKEMAAEWVSVDDRLPRIEQKVLICINGIVQEEVYELCRYDCDNRDGSEFFWIHESSDYWDECPDLESNQFWMPLPPAPEGK